MKKRKRKEKEFDLFKTVENVFIGFLSIFEVHIFAFITNSLLILLFLHYSPIKFRSFFFTQLLGH